MSRASVGALLAIANPGIVPNDVLDHLVKRMPQVQEADPAWGLVLEESCEYDDLEGCLNSVEEHIKSSGVFPKDAGLLLRVAVYNEAFTYTGRIEPRQIFVDCGLAIELSIYPTDD
ncbi:hypothetical protein [Lysobacter sp. CA199]|uniref:hypothetical protein n=1 Tax=Lysobacter sp. CA199 TaxID=3455608 RepID=UPI003F8D0AF0